MADSTLVQDFFTDLENPALFERVDNVPIFGKHTKKKKAPDGTWHTVKVEDEDLEEIGDACDEMEAKGNLPVITPGHRNLDPKVSEEDQPAPWGYMRWLRPGFYKAPDGKQIKTLLCTQYISKTARDKFGKPVSQAARTFPFRSVDYYADTHEITGLALLRRDPELDLGLISYGKPGRPFFLYASENPMAGEAIPPTKPPSVDAKRGGEMEDDELSPDEAGTAMRYVKHYERHHPAFKYMCDRYTAEQGGEGGAAGGDITPSSGDAIPEKSMPEKPTDGAPPKMPKEPKDVEHMQRNGMTVEQYHRELQIRDKRIEAQDRRLAALESRTQAAETASRLAQYQVELERLQVNESLEFDLADEMIEVQNKTPEQFQAHLKRLRKICKPAPVGRNGLLGIAYDRTEPGSNGGTGAANGRRTDGSMQEDVQARAMQYCRHHPNCSWEEAEAAALANKS